MAQTITPDSSGAQGIEVEADTYLIVIPDSANTEDVRWSIDENASAVTPNVGNGFGIQITDRRWKIRFFAATAGQVVRLIGV